MSVAKGKSVHVLHVDNETGFRERVATFLEHERNAFDVTTLTSARDGLEYLIETSRTIDCIVSDYDMPEMDGLEFLETVREEHPNLPFILFTGQGSEEIASEAITAGVSEYLNKQNGPDQYTILANRIENLVTQYQAECELKATNERIRSLYSGITDGIFTLDTKGQFTYLNERAEELLERSEEELLGESIEDEFPAGEGTLFESELDMAVRENRPVEFEEYYPPLDVWHHLRVVPTTDGLTVHTTDITKKKRHEQAISALHTATRDFVQAESKQNVAVATADAAEDILGFTHTAIRFYDPESDTLEPVALSETGGEQYGERPTYAHGEGLPWRAFESGNPIIASADAIDYCTTEFHSALYVPIGDHGTVSIVSQDSDFDDAEIELTQVLASNAAAALDRVEHETQLHRYQRMLDTAGDSIYALDTDGRFTAVNDTFLTQMGYARDELRGEHISEVLGPEAIEHGRSLIRGLLSGDHQESACGTYEFDVQYMDDNVHTCEAQVALLQSSGELEGTVGVIRDVSDKKRNETYRQKLYETTSSSGVTFDERIDRFLELGCEYLGVDTGFLTHIDGATQHIIAARGSHDLLQAGKECPFSKSYCRRTIEAEGPLAVHNAGEAGWEDDVAYEAFGLETYIGGKVTVDDEVYGTFCFADTTARKPFTTAEEGFVDLIARGAGREIERRKQKRTLETLHDSTREMVTANNPDEVTKIAVETITNELDMPVNSIWQYHETEENLRPVASSQESDELLASLPTYSGTSDSSLSWEVFKTGEPARYNHVDQEMDVHNPDTPIRSELILPIGDYGVMNIGSTEPSAFTDQEYSLAKLFAANIETAINRVEREHLLHQQRDELVAERDRLTALFENIPDAAISFEFVDNNPIVRTANAVFEDVFGYATNAVTGESIDEYIIPADQQSEAARFNEKLQAGEIFETTVRRQTTSGIRDFLLHVVPVIADEHNTEGYSIYTDITDQKRHERELERQNQLLDEFASVISHDLRNPMSVARGRVELVEAEAPSDHHEDALWALDRMETLIEDVLTLARQGKVIGETEVVELAPIAERAWRTTASETATLTIEELKSVEGDPDRLTRLFENIFRNAVEHASEDVSVVVGPFEDGFYVEDDGPGVPEGEHRAIFEHGYSTTDSGSGLGLMIVESIAEAHGWEIRATDGETGARFEVTVS